MRHLWILATMLLAACGSAEPPAPAARVGHYRTPSTADLPPAALPGGATTHVALKPGTRLAADAFSHPATNLPPSARGEFAVGNSFFTQPWVSAPASVAARDGLGPLFAAAACQDCHVRDGRGHAPVAGEPILAAAVRIARAGGRPDPIYGTHLTGHALPGVPAEARLSVRWEHRTATLPDGSTVELRRPQVEASSWGYGEPDAALRAGLRIAPPMIGLGLLEAIAESALLEQEQASASGRLNRVPDLASGATTIGRFGWKATQPNVRQQALDAFVNDIGITSALKPAEACTPSQRACRAQPTGGAPELTAAIERAVVFYARHLAPPVRRDHDRREVREGEALFHQIGCADCHRPSWTTGIHPDAPALSNQTIFPYTDLLLHDMGPDLADGIEEFEAGGRHWRTAPLWGLGLTHTVSGAQAGFLHDGRARTLAEATLWHGGDAQAARDAWASLPARERRLVVRFLASL